MIIKRSRLYSGYGEVNLNGIGYQSVQLTDNYLLNPSEKAIDYMIDSKAGQIKPVKKKLNLVKRIVSPVRSIIKNHRKDKKNK